MFFYTMPRMRQQNRDRALGMLEAGRSTRQVAAALNVNQSTVHRLQQRYAATGSSADRHRPGRPRVTTQNQDHYIRVQHLRNRFRTATATASETIGTHGRQLSARTVRNRLRVEGIRPRRPFVGAILTRRHRDARLQWCNRHRYWNLQRWSSVVFSDEKKFQCHRADGRQRVYRRVHERYAPACVRQINRWGGPSVMMWAAISANHRSQLYFIDGNLNAVRYRDEILQPIVVPFLGQVGPNAMFQQDNARPHVARVCLQFLEDNDVDVLDWPSMSPDLNPIENLWSLLSTRLYGREHPPQTQQQLRVALREEWAAIPQEQIRRLCLSMRRRINATINTHGGHINY